jgi:hypothetical protein
MHFTYPPDDANFLLLGRPENKQITTQHPKKTPGDRGKKKKEKKGQPGIYIYIYIYTFPRHYRLETKIPPMIKQNRLNKQSVMHGLYLCCFNFFLLLPIQPRGVGGTLFTSIL